MKGTIKFLSLIIASLVAVSCAGCVKQTPPVHTDGRVLVWSDEFNGDTLDEDKWGYQTGTRDYYGNSVGPSGWGNKELQYYTAGDNVEVNDGLLKITARREDKEGSKFTSSRIVTRDKFSQTYGYFEARMKLPAVSAMWPAFWLLPQPTDGSSSQNVYGGWAANGELDIMEARGRLPNRIETTLHYGGNYPDNKYTTHSTELESPIDEWHVYAVDWRETYIAWFIDETEVFRLDNTEWWTSASEGESAPYDQPFYILINLAVGGNFDGNISPSADFKETCMYVDYVRVYENVRVY